MTTTPLPQPFGWLCEWRQPIGEENTQVVYYGEPGSATGDDWNCWPEVHDNLPIFTADQMQACATAARADLEAENQRLREALEFVARHKSSDWPERCQQMVNVARNALKDQP